MDTVPVNDIEPSLISDTNNSENTDTDEDTETTENTVKLDTEESDTVEADTVESDTVESDTAEQDEDQIKDTDDETQGGFYHCVEKVFAT